MNATFDKTISAPYCMCKTLTPHDPAVVVLCLHHIHSVVDQEQYCQRGPISVRRWHRFSAILYPLALVDSHLMGILLPVCYSILFQSFYTKLFFVF